MREDTALGNFGDRALCSSHYAIRGTMLQGILDNCAAFQKLWDVILGGKVVIGVQTQMQSFNFFCGPKEVSCIMHLDDCNLDIFYSAIHTHHIVKLSKLQNHAFLTKIRS